MWPIVLARPLSLSLALPLTFALAQTPAATQKPADTQATTGVQEPVDGSKLPGVIGPQAPRVLDPAAGVGSSRSEIRDRHAMRQGTIPAVVVPADCKALTDRLLNPSGWKAYQIEVRAKASLIITLSSDRNSAFRLYTVNKWGRLETGMLQNQIYKGKPLASYINPKDQPATIYVVVDTSETNTMEPYTLYFSWK